MTLRPASRLRRASVLILLVLAACGGAQTSDTTPSAITYVAPEDLAPPYPDLDPGDVAAGQALYGQYCASCHQADLSGEPDWKTPNADGTYPAPPHDSSGHTWHHPDALLVQIVREGIDVPGTSMPTFGDKLTDPEIRSIIEYLKSSWDADERAAQWQVTWQQTRR